MRLVYLGSGWFPVVDFIRRRLPPGCSIARLEPGASIEDAVRDADVILPSNARITAEVLARAERLRLIQQPAVGYEGIDVEAARARGIPVCNGLRTNGASVAEAALLLILALARRLPTTRRHFERASIGQPLGVELAGKTLGLVGHGESGARLATVARALGMSVLAVTSKSSEAEFRGMLGAADVVSLHCPLTERTRGLIDRAAFSAMKPGVLLVNVARGAIIDRAALEEALASGWLGGVGLDVFWEEPWDPADPLFSREDVVVLPHVAGSTEAAFGRIAEIVAENVRRLGSGEPLLHRVDRGPG